MIDDDDERADALDRFERTVAAQFDLLAELDERLSNVARFASLLLGVIVAGLAVVARSTGSSLHVVGWVPRTAFLVGVAGFLVAIGFGVIAARRSRRKRGPGGRSDPSVLPFDDDGSPAFDASSTPDRFLLGGYASAVGRNTGLIDARARRYTLAVMSLLVGFVYCSLAGGLVILDASLRTELLVGGVVTGAVLAVVRVISSEGFSIIGRN